MPKVTPLLRFLRALTVEQQNAFAESVGTTRNYLYQLAAQAEPNPRLRMAMLIRDESRGWAKRVMTEPLTLDDLLTGAPPDTDD